MVERFYIDCEFDGHNGPLLSLAIVAEDHRSIYVRTTNEAHDPWVSNNVVPLLDKHESPRSECVNLFDVGGSIRSFLGEAKEPIIIADSPVDIGRFCAAISTGPTGQWISADYPRMTFEVHNIDCYPTDLPGAVQHNAWWDAMALRHRLATATTTNALAQRLEQAEKLLREVCDDLARSTPIQMPDPRISEDVEKLAVASGYGAIMQTASCLWRQYLADKGYPKGGEFIAGPCRTTAEMIIGRITAFLKQGKTS